MPTDRPSILWTIAHTTGSRRRAQTGHDLAPYPATMKPRGVPRLRDAVALAVARGLVVREVPHHGEVIVYRPGGRQLRVNVRRKDAPARLLTLVRRSA